MDYTFAPVSFVMIAILVYFMYRVFRYGPTLSPARSVVKQDIIDDIVFDPIATEEDGEDEISSAWNCLNCGGTSLGPRCDYCRRQRNERRAVERGGVSAR